MEARKSLKSICERVATLYIETVKKMRAHHKQTLTRFGGFKNPSQRFNINTSETSTRKNHNYVISATLAVISQRFGHLPASRVPISQNANHHPTHTIHPAWRSGRHVSRSHGGVKGHSRDESRTKAEGGGFGEVHSAASVTRGVASSRHLHK